MERTASEPVCIPLGKEAVIAETMFPSLSDGRGKVRPEKRRYSYYRKIQRAEYE
jgi:hypothetical protein